MVDASLPPPPPPRSPMGTITRLLFVALVLGLVSSLLPWVRVLFITVNGTDGDGKISLISAGIGIISAVLAERTIRRRVLLDSGTIACAAVTTFVYVYNLADVSRAAGDSTTELFDLAVSPQFGLVVGAVAAPIALLMSIMRLTDHLASRAGTAARTWSNWDLLAAGTAVTSLSFALSPTLWGVSLLLVVALACILWFAHRRTRLRTASTMLAAVGLAIASAGTVYGLVDDGGGTTLSTAMTESLQGLPVDDLQECSTLFSDGTPTSDLDDPMLCLDGGVETYVFPVTWECKDGRTLVSNEYGWGYRDSEWSTVGEAPFDRCNSTAQKPCTEVFVDGEITRDEWANDYIECFDDNGEIDYVITTRWECFDSDEIQLSNRYGWGYVGKEWVGGEESPFC